MTTYIAHFNLTEAGIKAAKESPRRLDAAKKLLADMGGEMTTPSTRRRFSRNTATDWPRKSAGWPIVGRLRVSLS